MFFIKFFLSLIILVLIFDSNFCIRFESFLYYVGEGRFLPVFFFSMFATAHDAGILGTDERVYFCFDNHGIDTIVFPKVNDKDIINYLGYNGV